MSPLKKSFSVLLILINMLGSIPFAEAAAVTRSSQLGQNLLAQSQTFTSPWAPGGSSLGTTDTAPDGTNTALRFIESNASTFHYTLQTPPSQSSSAVFPLGTYTFSIYAKAASRSWVVMSLNGGNVKTWFNLSSGVTGTVGAGITATIKSVGNGWYRISVTGAPTDFMQPTFYISSANNVFTYAGDGTSYIDIWGAQLVFGTSPGYYNRTITSALNTSLRPYGPFLPNIRGENWVTYSNTFSDASWTKQTGVTVARSTVVDPFGGYNAWLLDTTGAATNQGVYRTSAITGVPLNVSIYPARSTVWARAVSGTVGVSMSDAHLGASTPVTVGTTWQRLSLQYGLQDGSDRPWVSLATPGQAYIYNATYFLGTKNIPDTVTGATAAAVMNKGTVRSRQLGQNLLTYSDQFDNAAWVQDQGGTGSAPVRTANYEYAPDGTKTAERVQLDKGAGVGFSRIQQTGNPTDGAVYTFSVWMKTNDGTAKNVELRMFASGQVHGITGTWQRYVTTFPLTGSGIQILLYDAPSSNSADISVWGAQLVRGTSPGFYNKTTASALNASYVP